MCKSLTFLDLSSFDTSNVTNMSWMISKCTGLKKINTPKKSGTVTAALPIQPMYGSDGRDDYKELPVSASASIKLYDPELRYKVTFYNEYNQFASSENVFDGNKITVPAAARTGYYY